MSPGCCSTRAPIPTRAYVKTIPPRQAQGNINVAPGATPLYRAVRAIDLAAVQLLADRGADPSQAIKDGSTPLMAAAGLGAPRGGDEEVTEAGDRNDPIDVMKVLIAKGANVNAANDAGMTPLHYAAQRGSDRIIEFLASQGARFDVKNKQGRSPSELARGKTAALMNKLAAATPQRNRMRTQIDLHASRAGPTSDPPLRNVQQHFQDSLRLRTCQSIQTA